MAFQIFPDSFTMDIYYICLIEENQALISKKLGASW